MTEFDNSRTDSTAKNVSRRQDWKVNSNVTRLVFALLPRFNFSLGCGHPKLLNGKLIHGKRILTRDFHGETSQFCGLTTDGQQRPRKNPLEKMNEKWSVPVKLFKQWNIVEH